MTDDKPTYTGRSHAAHRRIKRGAWTDEVVHQIAALIEQGFTQKKACEYYGCNTDSLSTMIQGEEPQKPEWAILLRRARGKSFELWLGKLQEYGDAENNAGVKAALSMLRVLEPDFREDRMQTGGGHGTIVNVIAGGEHRPVDVQVIDVKTNKKALPAGGVNLT